VTVTVPISATAKFVRVPQCVVPRVIGLSLRRARAALARAHCALGRPRHAYSARIAKGDVLAQRPAPGVRWKAGSFVRVTLSLGPAKPARTVAIYGYAYGPRCPSAGAAHVVDRWGMYACNCTSYVAWALQQNGQRVDWFISGEMDARNWPRVAQLSRIAVGRQARVGAVAVWPRLSPPFGHVAYVTAVRPNGRFDVAEYNSPLNSLPFAFDRRYDLAPAGASFIYVPR
jgi:surface antigen